MWIWTNESTRDAYEAFTGGPGEMRLLADQALRAAETVQGFALALREAAIRRTYERQVGEIISPEFEAWLAHVPDWGLVDWHQIAERIWNDRALDVAARHPI